MKITGKQPVVIEINETEEYWYGWKKEMNCDEVVESWFREHKEEVVG